MPRESQPQPRPPSPPPAGQTEQLTGVAPLLQGRTREPFLLRAITKHHNGSKKPSRELTSWWWWWWRCLIETAPPPWLLSYLHLFLTDWTIFLKSNCGIWHVRRCHVCNYRIFTSTPAFYLLIYTLTAFIFLLLRAFMKYLARHCKYTKTTWSKAGRHREVWVCRWFRWASLTASPGEL